MDEMTPGEQTTRRLLLAGYTRADRALRWIREWNTRAYQRAAADG